MPPEISILAYDAIGLIYYAWKKNKSKESSTKEITEKIFTALSYNEAKKKNPDYFDDLIKPRFSDDVKVALYILGTDKQAADRWKVVRQFWLDYFKDNKLKPIKKKK